MIQAAAKTKTKPKKTPLAVVCSDNHLQERAWADRPTLRGDAYWAFEQLVNLAIGYSVPLLVAGDLIDKKINDSRPIRFLSQQLDKLAAAGIPFGYVQGDHDKLDPPWPSTHHWSTHFDQYAMSHTSGNVLYGLDYRPGGQLQEALAEIPPQTTILLCHQRWTDVHGGLIACDGSLSEVPHVKMVISGDHHKHYVQQHRGAQGQQITLLSPGAGCLQSIAEPFDHYGFLLYGDLSVEDLELVSRPAVRTPVVGTPADLEAAVADTVRYLEDATAALAAHPWEVPEHLYKPIVDFHYLECLPNAINDFTSGLAGQFPGGVHLFTKVYYPERETQEIERQQREQVIAGGLTGCLGLLVPEKTSPLYQGVARLLAAGQRGEAKQELAAQRKEYGLE